MRGFFRLSTLVSEKPESDMAQCGHCKLKKYCKSPMIPTKNKEQPLMIVGNPPSETEDETGKWLSGESGDFLKQTLSDLGSCPYSYIGSLICRPANLTKPIHIIGTHIKDCRPNIINQIRQQKPKVVLLLGDFAIRSVIGSLWKKLDSKNMDRWYGWKIPIAKYKCWIVPTFSLRDVLDDPKNKVKYRMFLDHIKKAISLAKQVEVSEITKRHKRLQKLKDKIELFYDAKDAIPAIQRMSKQPVTAFDYEATALKPEYEGARIVTASISDGKRTIAFPFTKSVQKEFKKYLQSDSKKIAANMKYEDRMTNYHYGTRNLIRNWAFDTVIGAHLEDCRRGITGLKFQAFVKMGILTYDDAISDFLEAEGKGKINRVLQDVSMEQLLTYNAEDSLYEWHLAVDIAKSLGIYDSVFGGI